LNASRAAFNVISFTFGPLTHWARRLGSALPIVINGNQMIGAIGVGGSARNVPIWSDEICAWRALTKVIGPQPPLLPDVQPTGTR
jgi:hypothetical protein